MKKGGEGERAERREEQRREEERRGEKIGHRGN
jgi:hypothetical protein